jgi:hypothetical protein
VSGAAGERLVDLALVDGRPAEVDDEGSERDAEAPGEESPS